jgi:hypothetical protein
VAPFTPTIVVVVRAVVVVVVDTLGSSASLDGVPGIAVGPEMALDRRRRSLDSVPLSLLLRRRRVRAVGRWRSSPPALRVLVRGGDFRLLSCRSLK